MSEKGPEHDTSITSNLDEYGLGSLIPEIERNQDNVVADVSKYGGSGTVTMVLTYKLNDDDTISVSSKVTPKTPPRKLTAVPMHQTKKGKLSPYPEGQYTSEQVKDVLKKDDKPVDDIGKKQADVLDLNKKQSNGAP